MENNRKSPFDNFWGFNPSEERKEKTTETEGQSKPNWPDLFEEASKTWKSVSPMIKPMFDRFKK
ncbi:hypothetical protein QRD89_05715 [Halobacillus sp. ACCC02827]|uniref:hypothetical protein n=1 Tax=Bacillaceae TaxID=186817 RepID=UPI0002A4FC10|nr:MULTISPECIES: hypothetical protein [Bacillaceae]ELK45216.1 hypothetical protein D479_15842 [Halobacillus sp. BAB-2008]QHT46030.1 hypothetical protein M662_05835 [Bacillus sp. SB49]WJE16844.1 hypothetical protein QRD89_05715 [Halobacillus sp. ACCC02827]